MVNPYKTVEQEQKVYDNIMDIVEDNTYKEVIEDFESADEVMYNLKYIVFQIREKARGKNDEVVRVQSEQMLKELTKLNITMK